jgi:hypothetical protein
MATLGEFRGVLAFRWEWLQRPELSGATLEALFLIAAFCRLEELLNYSKQMGLLVGAVGKLPVQCLCHSTRRTLVDCLIRTAKDFTEN